MALDVSFDLSILASRREDFPDSPEGDRMFWAFRNLVERLEETLRRVIDAQLTPALPIEDFSEAQHDHSSAAEGGTIDHDDLTNGGTTSHSDIDAHIAAYGVVTPTRIDDGDSPYTALATDSVIVADTDGGAITVNLPAGVAGRYYKITNVGSAGNDVTLAPNGAELLFGENASETIYDSEVFEIHYQATEGWR